MLLLFYPLKSYRHSALRDSCLKQVPFMAVCQYLNAKVQKVLIITKKWEKKLLLDSSLPPPCLLLGSSQAYSTVWLEYGKELSRCQRDVISLLTSRNLVADEP